MTIHDYESDPIVSQDAAVRAAERTVANALSTDFSIDPIVGADFSRPFAVIASVVQRHGLLIPRTLGDVLTASGRFEVFTEMSIDIPAAADELIKSRNSKKDLARIKLHADSRAARTVAVDLVVVDSEAGWAGAYDCKRGNGATESRRRQHVEHDLIAIRTVLASHLARSGFDIVKVTTGVIDWFGASGFSDDVRIRRQELDRHFGVPVVAAVDRMTTALQQALHGRLRSLIEPAMRSLPPPETAEAQPAVPSEHQNVTSIFARPEGPGPWKLRGKAAK